jgi:hypothetical protein
MRCAFPWRSIKEGYTTISAGLLMLWPRALSRMHQLSFRTLAGAALALFATAAAAGADPPSLPWLPDPRLTPGAFAESSTAAICVRGYDRAHRVRHDKAGTAAKYRHR